MSRLVDLRFGFVLVAVVEAAYALIGLLPQSVLSEATGWNINPDGQWVVKLLAMALASQAFVAWVLVAIPTHYLIGLLLILGIRASRRHDTTHQM